MGYVAPTTRATDYFVTAATWNQDIVDNQNAAFPLGIDAWTAWVPTTNITVGDGSVVARYQRIGRTVLFQYRFTFGTTSAMATSPNFSLPVAINTTGLTSARSPLGNAVIFDASGTQFSAELVYQSTDLGLVLCYNTAGTFSTAASVSSTVPMTWATGDLLLAQGVYEANS